MLRAADLALANGCNWFVLISVNGYSETYTMTTPTIATPTGADPTSGAPTTVVTGGQTSTVNSPTVQLMVKILSKKLDDASVTVFDAQFLSKSIRKEYGINPTQ